MSQASERIELPQGLDLVETKDGLTLIGDGLELRADFSKIASRLKPGIVQSELLVKASKIKGGVGSKTMRNAIDATAGLGEDSILLAAAGFKVKMFERNPVIAALLRDALERASETEGLSEIIARMELVEGDSIDAMRNLKEDIDVIVLDPMFPEKRKSALVKKKFQLLHQLERPCDDEMGLVDAAIAAHPRKIVIKRPPKGPYLADIKPAYSISGKSVRYDCLVFAK